MRSISEISVSGGIKMALTPARTHPKIRLTAHKTVASCTSLLRRAGKCEGQIRTRFCKRFMPEPGRNQKMRPSQHHFTNQVSTRAPGSTGINHHTKDLDVSARMLEKHSPRRRGSKSFSAIQHGVAHLRYNQGFAQETAQIWLEIKRSRFLRLHRF